MNVKKIFFFIFILLPPFYIIYLITRYGIDIPYWDQWELIPLIKKVSMGELVFSDLWAQHNEHRIIFPKLIMLALAAITHWNIMVELYTNIILAGLSLLFLFLLLRQDVDHFILQWLSVVLSFLIFSPTQWENWIWGWQIQVFLEILASIIAVWAMSKWSGQLKGLIVAIMSAVIASYSFSNGLLVWVIVLILLIIQRETNWKHILLWMGACGITVFSYYYRYTKPPHHPSLLGFVNHPYKFLRYVLAYLGSPLGYGKENISIIISLLSFTVICIGAIYIKRSNKEEFKRLLKWLSLALCAFLSAIVTGIGRVGFGVEQGLSSRYITISNLFIISALVITVILINRYANTKKNFPMKWVVISSSLSTLLILSYFLSFSMGLKELVSRSLSVQTAGRCLENVDMAPDECLNLLYPNPPVVRERTKILLEMGLVFPKQRIQRNKIGKLEMGLFYIDTINGLICSKQK